MGVGNTGQDGVWYSCRGLFVTTKTEIVLVLFWYDI